MLSLQQSGKIVMMRNDSPRDVKDRDRAAEIKPVGASDARQLVYLIKAR